MPKRMKFTPSPKIAAGGAVHDGVPVYLSFADIGALAGVTAGAIRFYYYKDCKLGRPNLMPQPAVILNRGTDNIMPGWTEEQVYYWIANRPGAGNHTYGADRVGHQDGRADAIVLEGATA